MLRYRPRALGGCHSIADLRELARRRLPLPIFEYLDGGAESEWTLQHNTVAFESARLVPRVLRNVSSINTTTTILGQSLDWPVFCSPTGASRLYHPQGELAVARAAGQTGTLYGLSIAATHSLEQVAAATTGPKFFQLLGFKDAGLTREFLERCREAGYPALCLTVDASVRAKRERELRHGLGLTPKLPFLTAARCVTRPGWWLGQLWRGPLRMSNLSASGNGTEFIRGTQALGRQLDATFTWKGAADLIQQWGGPFAIKGILCVEDARRAVDIGATAIIVSNHGGRQLDGAAAPFEVLPEIVEAVGDRVEVILDGGVRRGADVLKALACGAKACSIGRPYLFGLAAGGELGVLRALQLLRQELICAMQLTGCVDVRQVSERILRAAI